MPIFAVALRNNAYRQHISKTDYTLWYVGSAANALVASSIAVPAKSILQNGSRRTEFFNTDVTLRTIRETDGQSSFIDRCSF
jgi:hypothetical protein